MARAGLLVALLPTVEHAGSRRYWRWQTAGRNVCYICFCRTIVVKIERGSSACSSALKKAEWLVYLSIHPAVVLVRLDSSRYLLPVQSTVSEPVPPPYFQAHLALHREFCPPDGSWFTHARPDNRILANSPEHRFPRVWISVTKEKKQYMPFIDYDR